MKKKKRRKQNNIGVIVTAVVLVLLLALAGMKLVRQGAEQEIPEPEGVQQEQAGTANSQEISGNAPSKEEEGESQIVKTEEEERASFLPDYTSAPLLNTTAIKCLSMEVGAADGEVRFNWFSPSGSKGSVVWKNADTGEVQTFVAQCSASTVMAGYYVNKVSVTGIQAGCSYTYQVGNDDAWSPEYAYTAPKREGEGLTFLVTADAQIGQSQMEMPEETAERWDSVLTRLADYVPEADFMFHLGDQVADFGSTEQYDLFFEHLALFQIPLAPVVGDHDVANDYSIDLNSHPAGTYFYEHYNVPNRSETAQSQYDRDGDYYFIRGNVLFIVLNSITNQPQETHEAYVAQVVAEHPEVTWRILVQHHSAYSGVAKSRNDNSKEYLARIASENDIDLVLTGHDHAYSRTAFVNGLCETLNDYDYESGAVVTNPEGTLYVTCGTSSGCLYHPIAEEIRIVFQGQPETPTAIRIDVTGQELHLRTYLVENWSVYDEYTIRKE